MEKVRCPICGNLTKKDIYCEHCGLVIRDNINFNNYIRNINEHCSNIGINIKFYEFKNGKYSLNQANFTKLIHKAFEIWPGPGLRFIENVLSIEAYDYIHNNHSISKNMAFLFCYLCSFVPGQEKFMFYWNKRAIKEGHKEQIEWSIVDNTYGFYVKKSKRKAEKLKKLLRKQRI